MLSFRNRLLIILIGLVVGAQIVTLFTALASTHTEVRRQATQQLLKGAQEASEDLERRQRDLGNAASLLTADWALRAAWGLNDVDALSTVLENHARRIGADLALAFDLDGKLLARQLQSPMSDAQLAAAMEDLAESGDNAATFLLTVNGIHQVTTATVEAPDEIGRVVLGFSADQALAEQLAARVSGEVAFLAGEPGGFRIVSGTPALMGDDSTGLLPALRDSPIELTVHGRDYLATATHLSEGNELLDLALLVPMDTVMAPFWRLAWILGAIFGISLLLAVVAGFYLGGSAARPVLQLARSAERIAAGDYSQHVQSAGGRELANLADAFNSMQSGIAERELKLKHLALHDLASGIPNRVFMMEWLRTRLDGSGARRQLAVVQCTITNLQEISATLGYAVAGELVLHVARQLQAAAQGDACVARLEGAEFVAAQSVGDDKEALVLADRMHALCTLPLSTAGITLRAVVVLGVAVAPTDASSAEEALRCAHAATEAAMASSNNIGRFVQASDDAQRRRLTLGADLPGALQAKQLHLLYQPKIRLSDRRVVGVEALVRWQHPLFGAVSPVEFVPIAERTGASAQLTRWVLGTTCEQLSAWIRNDIQIGASVNLSAADLLDQHLVRDILRTLRAAELPAGALTLEITESVLLQDPDTVRHNMEMLRLAGVRFSIDDFGTGYSSLSQLRELAADELKIDQSFVRGNQGDAASHTAMLRAIVEMAHGLGLRTVAEGVEDEDHCRLLTSLGCEYAQGYLFSKPATAAQLAAMLEASRGQIDEAQTASLRVLELRRRES